MIGPKFTIPTLEDVIEQSRLQEIRSDVSERKLAVLSAVGDALVTELRSAHPVRETILAILHEWETVRGQ